MAALQVLLCDSLFTLFSTFPITPFLTHNPSWHNGATCCVCHPHKWRACPQCSRLTPQQFLWKPQQVRPIKVSLDLKWDTRWIFERLRAVWVPLWKRRIGGTAVRWIPVKLQLLLAKEVPVNYFLPLCPLFASLSVFVLILIWCNGHRKVISEVCEVQRWLIC